MRIVATLVLLFATAVPRAARANELELATRASCDLRDLAAEVEAALGRPLGAGEAAIRARVAMRPERGRVHVVVGLEGSGVRSERSFAAPDCAHATHATALILALALGGARATASAVDPPPASPTASAAPEALELVFDTQLFAEPSDPPEPARAEPASAVRARLAFTSSALVDAGSLPGIEGGARAGVGLSVAPALVELDATYLSGSRAASAEPGASVDLVLAFATLRLGARWAVLDRLALAPAAELDVGAMGGTGVGARLDQSTSAWAPWVALRATVLAELTITEALALRVHGSFGMPLSAPRFDVVGVGTAFSSSPWLAAGGLGLVVWLS